jgi:hypothetical protein
LSKNSIEQLLQQGIAAANRGDKAQARQLLESVLAKDDRNELAWIWMATVVSTVKERRVCLERVLQINPNNERAKQALKQLGVAEPTTTRTAPAPARNTNATLQNNGIPRRYIVGGVLAAVVGLLLLSSLFAPRTQTVIATTTPLPQEVIAQMFSPTPVPTTTPAIVIVTLAPRQNLPPTFTPTATLTPEPTLQPSPTAFPSGSYTFLYTTLGQNENVPSLYQILGDGTGQQPLLENVTEFAYSNNGQQVAFVRLRQTDAPLPTSTLDTEVTAEAPSSNRDISASAVEIFVANVDDLANARQLTSLGSATASSLSWSPDDASIAFSSDFTGDPEIYVVTVADGFTQQLTDNEFIDIDPTWSPDGQRLVFASDRQSPGFLDLFSLVFVPNGDPVVEQITSDAGNSYAPKYSPNGERIIYLNDGSGSADVFIIAPDGQRQLVLVAEDAEIRSATWSPDARFIVFVSNRQDDRFQVYFYDIEEDTITRVNNDGRESLMAGIRPDLIFRLLGRER